MTEWIYMSEHGVTKSAGWDKLRADLSAALAELGKAQDARLAAQLTAEAAVSAPPVACAHTQPEDA